MILSLKVQGSGNPPDSTICLRPKEFDFYAQAVVERKQLRKDTSVLRNIISSKDTIIFRKGSQLLGCQLASTAKDSIATTYKDQFLKEKSAKETAQKKLGRFKNFSLILGSAAGVLLAILLIVI